MVKFGKYADGSGRLKSTTPRPSQGVGYNVLKSFSTQATFYEIPATPSSKTLKK